MLLAATTTAFCLIALAIRVALRRRDAPALASHLRPETPADVTVLLPVRDEEDDVEACVETLARQTALPNIRVINDGSRDATVEKVEALRARHSRLVLLHAPPLPAGWKGKIHALAFGLEDAGSPYILMTDADTRHHPELLQRALSTMDVQRLDSISIAGYQEARGIGENLLIPTVFALLDGLLGDWNAAYSGESAVANGQFILAKRSALERIGGLAAIREEPLDDIALAAFFRKNHLRHSFVRATDLLRIRMYRGLPEAFHGWRRIFGTLLGKSHGTLALSLLLLLGPPALLVVSLAQSAWLPALVLWLGGVAASAICRATSGHGVAFAIFYPMDALLLASCVTVAWTDARRGRLASWKGRAIDVPKMS